MNKKQEWKDYEKSLHNYIKLLIDQREALRDFVNTMDTDGNTDITPPNPPENPPPPPNP